MSGERDGNDYLTMYPELRKWINQCVACQREGYEPSMPDDARGARNLKRYFPALSANGSFRFRWDEIEKNAGLSETGRNRPEADAPAGR